MEGKDVDLLLGLDMLKKHQMCIDLSQNCLRVQDDTIQFLPEHEIPKMMEDVLENEPKVAGPGGATIGAKTGTVEATGSPESHQTQPPTQNPASTSSFAQPQAITEQSIKQVTDMGFSRDEAMLALQQVNGNVEMALGLLMDFN